MSTLEVPPEAIVWAVELKVPVSRRLLNRLDPHLLARRKAAALKIEDWLIKVCLKTRKVRHVRYTTWCGKLHGLYLSTSGGETVVTPFFLGRENGPSVVRRNYLHLLGEDLVEGSTEPGELIHYLTSAVYLEAVGSFR